MQLVLAHFFRSLLHRSISRLGTWGIVWKEGDGSISFANKLLLQVWVILRGKQRSFSRPEVVPYCFISTSNEHVRSLLHQYPFAVLARVPFHCMCSEWRATGLLQTPWRSSTAPQVAPVTYAGIVNRERLDLLTFDVELTGTWRKKTQARAG